MVSISRSGLRARLITLVLFAVLPALAFILLSAWQHRRLAAVETQKEALRLARAAAADQNRLVEGTRVLLSALSRVPEVAAGVGQACEQILVEVLEMDRRYLNLGVVAPDGGVTCSAIQTKGHVNVADMPYFRRAVESRAFSVGGYQIGKITGRPSINFGFPVLDAAGRVRAVVFAALDLAWLNELLAGADSPRGSAVTVIDGAGNVLARYPHPERWVGRAAPESRIVGAIRDRPDGVVEAVDLDGVEALFGFTSLHELVPEQRLSVAVAIPKVAALSWVNLLLRGDLIFLSVLVILMLVMAWAGSDVLILRPVRSLVEAARRFGAGDLGTRSGVPRGHGEVGELAGAFDEMAEALQRREVEAREAQEALRRKEEQFQRSQKMEAVGMLAGGIAHDFNNLLTAIVGYSELLLTRFGENVPLRKEVEEINRAADRAAALTRQLLAFSRHQVLEPRVLDLNAVVEDLSKMLRRLIGEHIELVTIQAPDLGRVKADPGQIEQVIMNLVVNARDAVVQGGRVTIGTGNADLDGATAGVIEGARPGPFVVLTVGDTGCGMDAQTQARIFEPFFTTKAPGKGTGLGLATVYGIVRQSGGCIAVESQPGRGTTFTIYLPRVEQALQPAGPAVPVAPKVRGTETVLLVEDDPIPRTIAAEILQAYGYTVLTAADGEEALQIVEHHAGTIHLLLTDIVMPRLGGPGLAERTAERLPGVRVMFMSGYADRTLAEQGIPEPSYLCLKKPFTPGSLLLKVREALDRPPRPGIMGAVAS